jgi:hypothetical protein
MLKAILGADALHRYTASTLISHYVVARRKTVLIQSTFIFDALRCPMYLDYKNPYNPFDIMSTTI